MTPWGDGGLGQGRVAGCLFEAVNRLADVVGNGDRLLGLVVEQDDDRLAIGGDRLEPVAVDRVLHGQAGPAEAGDSGPDRNPVGVEELFPVIAAQIGQDRSDAVAGQDGVEAALFEVGDPCRFEPAEVYDIVNVLEGVLVAPLDGEGKQGGEFRQSGRLNHGIHASDPG